MFFDEIPFERIALWYYIFNSEPLVFCGEYHERPLPSCTDGSKYRVCCSANIMQLQSRNVGVTQHELAELFLTVRYWN